jgi:glyoxylase I family protein
VTSNAAWRVSRRRPAEVGSSAAPGHRQFRRRLRPSEAPSAAGRYAAFMAAFRLLALDHVVLRVADLERARAFYCGVLGCAFEKWQEQFGLLQLRAGASLIDLIACDGPLGRMGGAPAGAQGRNVDHFCLRIEPFDEQALRAHLSAHGVPPGEVVQRYGAEGTGPSLYLTDPDGNVVELKGPASTCGG